MLISNIMLWLVVLFQFIIIFMLAKAISNFLNNLRATGKRLEKSSLSIGEKAPNISVMGINGKSTLIPGEADGKYTLLVFSNDNCSVCNQLLPELYLIRQLNSDIKTVVIKPETRERQDAYIADEINYIYSSLLFEEYQAKTIPYFVFISPEGYILDLGIASSYLFLESQLREFFNLHALKIS